MSGEPTQESDVEQLAHRMAWRYKHSSDPHHSHIYSFNRSTLLRFAEALRAGTTDRHTVPPEDTQPEFDLVAYLNEMRAASVMALGHGLNTADIADRCVIRLKHVLAEPTVARHWLSFITFGIEGAQRAGANTPDIIGHLETMLDRMRQMAADPSIRDAYEQTDHTARHTDVASREV